MKWIVITRPSLFVGEVPFLHLLFEAGIDGLHLRKPEATEEQCAEILAQLTGDERRRTVVHQHFRQAEQFHLGGIHLNRRCPQPPQGFSGAISRSCHSLDEVLRHKDRCRYVFLSPIFDSVSKRNYHSAFSADTLGKAAAAGVIDERVYALGGVTVANISLLRTFHFGGAAMLGCIDALSERPNEEIVKKLRQIKDTFGQ